MQAIENDEPADLSMRLRVTTILYHLGQLHTCLQTAYAQYLSPTNTDKAGNITALANRFTSWRQGTHHQGEWVGKLIAELEYEPSKPSEYFSALLKILNSDDLTDDTQQGRTSILSHLIDAVHKTPHLLSALDLSTFGTEAALADHETVSNKYNCKIRYGISLQTLESEQAQKDHKIYRCFFRDYLRAVLSHWQQLPLDKIRPFNFLLNLCQHVPIREHLLSFLGEQDIQNLGLATHVRYPLYQKSCDALFYRSREHYLERTRVPRAQTLRNLVLDWNYYEIEALVTLDPKVLSIRCDYKMNRWQEDTAIRCLSALEYAWHAGDENFIELFERLGKRHLPASCYQNQDALQKKSRVMLAELVTAISIFAKGGTWGDVAPLWRAAPHWVYALAYFFEKDAIDTEVKVQMFDVFSLPSLMRAGPAGRESLWSLSLYCPHLYLLAVAVYLSESLGPHRRSPEPILPEPPSRVKYTG